LTFAPIEEVRVTPDQSLRLQQPVPNAPSFDGSTPPPPAEPRAPISTAATGPSTGFVYDGKLGELYGIFLRNLLWTLLTLTLFRFWAKTRMRRYLWSRTSLNGDRFEYTGTGGEMFLGFLIVMPVYLLFIFGANAAYYGLDISEEVLVGAQIVGAFLIFYLTFVAQYAAQRYRLTRTLWRGIRGGMTGSAWTWGFKAMFFGLLTAITLTLALPWTQMRLLSDRLNHSYFGDAKAQADLESGPVFVTYLVGAFCAFIGSLIVVIIGTTLIGLIVAGMGATSTNPMDLQTKPAFIIVTFAIFAVIYLLIALISVLAFSYYQTAVAREVAAKLQLGGLRFATTVTPSRFMGRYIGNILIVVFTLGFGLPIAIHRTMLFMAANIQVVGEIEGSEITHANLPRPKAGEGLLEAFDPGFL
jgi:uncharacterized membrane protein YjgN (DUF898 family)